MERTIKKDLIKWKSSPDRKPLVLKGARQVGKTYILEKFGQECHSTPQVYQVFCSPLWTNDLIIGQPPSTRQTGFFNRNLSF